MREPDSAGLILTDGDPPSKRAILCAALELFVSKGYDATSIRDVAAKAGYTNPAIFKFFRSKEELGVYLFERSYRELLDKFETHFIKDGPLDAVLREWMTAYVELLAENLNAMLFVHDHLAGFWPRVARRFGNRTLFKLMREWLERGRSQRRISTAAPIEIQIAAVSGFFHQFAKMIYLGEIDARKTKALRDGGVAILSSILSPDAPQMEKA